MCFLLFSILKESICDTLKQYTFHGLLFHALVSCSVTVRTYLVFKTVRIVNLCINYTLNEITLVLPYKQRAII